MLNLYTLYIGFVCTSSEIFLCLSVRLTLRHKPVLRDRLFTAVLVGAFAHGSYLVYPYIFCYSSIYTFNRLLKYLFFACLTSVHGKLILYIYELGKLI